MRSNGMKQCDYCYAVIEGMVGDYCNDECRRAHDNDLAIGDEDDTEDTCCHCGSSNLAYNHKGTLCLHCGHSDKESQ
jgi:hypothetical protein